MTIQAVIFDMDGLLFDTERLARDAWMRAMADHGYTLEEQLYPSVIGRTSVASREVFLREFGTSLPIEAIEAAKAEYLRELLSAGPPLKEGLADLLDSLERVGLKTAVASSTARVEVEERLTWAGLRDRFAAVIGGDDVTRGKPAPDLFLLAAGQLAVRPEDCVVLEDSEAGIRAAAAAAMTPVMVPDLVEPSPHIRQIAAAVVPSLAGVLAVLQEVDTIDRFFAEHHESRPLFDAVRSTIAAVGPAELRVTESQIAFRRQTGFAAVWIPDMYLRATGVPLVLTIGLRRCDDSPRWKQVVEAAPGRFSHHLELRSACEVDEEVGSWLREAWELAHDSGKRRSWPALDRPVSTP